MLNLLRVLLLGALIALPAPSWSGSMTLLGVGKPGAAATYQGPGDIQAFTSWWGFRAYSAAKAGTKAIRVRNTGTTTQTDINSLANGALDASAVTAACSGGCTLVTTYDQVGTADVTQSIVANQPAITANALNSSYCATYNASSLASSVTFSASQPYSSYVVAKQPLPGTNVVLAISNGFGSGYVHQISGGTNYNAYAGNVFSTTGLTLSNFNSFLTVYNSTSSVNNVNGSETTGDTGTFSISASVAEFGGAATGQIFLGLLCEAGYVAGTISIGNRAALNTNMHAAYGGGW